MFRSVFREKICIPKMAMPYSQDVGGLNSLTFLLKAIIRVLKFLPKASYQILTKRYMAKLLKRGNN